MWKKFSLKAANSGVLCSSSISEHLIRGILALAALLVIAYAWPNLWVTLIFLPVAILLMRGCPTCWLFGLIETTTNKFRNRRPQDNQ